jgi:Rrf2 family iron-sulfur cluster assembly transcriptional regulator
LQRAERACCAHAPNCDWYQEIFSHFYTVNIVENRPSTAEKTGAKPVTRAQVLWQSAAAAFQQGRPGKMQLSTKARYGLRALCHVAHRGYASAHVIAEQQAIPSRYLEEIIGELRKAGFVVGKRGPRGGYKLARPAADIAVAEVLQALSTPTNGGPSTGDPQDEITRMVERSVDARFEAAVGQLSLEQLLGEARENHRRRGADLLIA